MNQFQVREEGKCLPVCQTLCNSGGSLWDTHTHTLFNLHSLPGWSVYLQFTDEEAEIQGSGHLCQVSQLVNINSAACDQEESYDGK